MARANVSSSDRSELLLLGLRFSYILVVAGGWFCPLSVIILYEHAFPPTGFVVAWFGCSLHIFIPFFFKVFW